MTDSGMVTDESSVLYAKASGPMLSKLPGRSMLSNEQLKEMADGYGLSVAQLCLRWELQNGVIPLPKSVTPERIEQNTKIFDFEISEEDMAKLNALPYIGSGLTPETFSI